MTQERLAEYLELQKSRCNKLTNGACLTAACLARGGWKRGDSLPIPEGTATCADLEIHSLLEAQPPAPAELKKPRRMQGNPEYPGSIHAAEHDEHPACDLLIPCQPVEAHDLDAIIEAARKHVMTDAEKQVQVESFARGNVALSQAGPHTVPAFESPKEAAQGTWLLSPNPPGTSAIVTLPGKEPTSMYGRELTPAQASKRHLLDLDPENEKLLDQMFKVWAQDRGDFRSAIRAILRALLTPPAGGEK